MSHANLDAYDAPPPPVLRGSDEEAHDADFGTLDTGATRTGQLAAAWLADVRSADDGVPSTIPDPTTASHAQGDEVPDTALLTAIGVGVALLLLAFAGGMFAGLL